MKTAPLLVEAGELFGVKFHGDAALHSQPEHLAASLVANQASKE
jgi:hypothetical protein